MIRVTFLDMDGVLADFCKHALAHFEMEHRLDTWPAGNYNIEEVVGMPQDDFWLELDNVGPGFWSTIPELPWAHQLVALARAKSEDYYISTSPSRAPASSMGKVHWLQRFFDPRFRRYMLGSHKHLLAKPDVVLIDDSDEKCRKFIEAGGHAILLPQPWNANHGLVDPEKEYGGRMDYVDSRMNEITELLEGN